MLELTENEETGFRCNYYFVDHSSRSVFWLDNFIFSEVSGFYICATVKGVTSPSHIRMLCCFPSHCSLAHYFDYIGHEIESQYWFHCQQFPHSFALTDELVDELRDVIMHWIGGKSNYLQINR